MCAKAAAHMHKAGDTDVPVMATLWEHGDFKGFAKTSSTGNSRYYWNRWGATNDVFSSTRAWALGHRGNAYAFEHSNFDGNFAALNVGGAFTSSWWSSLGYLDNKVSSSLIIAREPQANEIEVPLRSQVGSRFKALFDAQTAGTKLTRRGEPRVFGNFFPGYDIGRVFLQIDQDLRVEVNNWPDYDANVKYDIEFYIDANRRLRGYCRWSHVWVEGGVFSGTIKDRIAPKLHGAKGQITAAIQQQLNLFQRYSFRDVYLLPGPIPDMNQFGFMARHTDDVILVVVR